MQGALRNLEAPQHAAGIVLRQAIGGSGEPRHRERLRNPALALRPGDEVEPGREQQVLVAGEIAVGGEKLGHIADAGADLPGFASQIATGDAGVPARRRQECRQHLDQRRLARTVRADQAENLARADLEVDMVHGNLPIEGLGQGRRLDQQVRRRGFGH